MIIRKTRIRSIERYLALIKKGEKLVCGVMAPAIGSGRLRSVGFTKELLEGETVLPLPQGPVSAFNAEGAYIKLKDQPMETVYRQREWEWEEFRGRYDRVQRSKIVDVPYKRYPRTFVPPPSLELSIASNTRGDKLVVLPTVTYGKDAPRDILHKINLLLELFGECQLFRDNLDEIIRGSIRRLNWEVLPKGEMPWENLKKRVGEVLDREPEQNQPVITKRLETINQRGPDFVAVGRAGFNGYIVFGFPKKKLYLLESVRTNNATYIFDKNWEALSQMTKAEILSDKLQKDRLIHKAGWFSQVRQLLA